MRIESTFFPVYNRSHNNDLYSAHIKGLYQYEPNSESTLQVSVHGVSYLSALQTVPLGAAHSVRAVLRTPDAYVDRVRIRVAFQLRDAFGHVMVDASGASVLLNVTLGGSSVVSSCHTGNVAAHNVAFCSRDYLPPDWFVGGGVATTAVVLRVGDVDISESSAGTLTVHAQPAWYGSLGGVLTSAGVFAALPTSPVYAEANFEVALYAHTGGNSLEAYSVELYYENTRLEYMQHVGSDMFNTIVFQDMGTFLVLNPVGKPAHVSDATTTGTAVYLATVTMRFRNGVAAATYAGAFSVRVSTFVNPGGVTFLEQADGVVLDLRNTAQGSAQGSMVVKAVQDVGLFAYLQTTTLANLALLTNVTQAYEVSAVVVSDYDAADMATSVSAACSTSASALVLTLNGCMVELSSAQSEGAAAAVVTAAYASLSADVSFSVYVPAAVSVTAADAVLHQLEYASGGSGTCSDYTYQRTRLSAMADGLDVTPLVSFAVNDTWVAKISSDFLVGLSPGIVSVYLEGRDIGYASTSIEVSSARVTAVNLTSRVVTGARWDEVPPSSYFGLFRATAQLSTSMTAEGHYGRIFSRVEWSDGQLQDVGPDLTGSSELNVMSQTDNVNVSLGGDNFWQAMVPFGANSECSRGVAVQLLLCGQLVASGDVPLLIDLPDAVGLVLDIGESRLAPADDDATLVDVKDTATLMLTTTFDDGSSRDMTTDRRVAYSVDDTNCATVVGAELRAKAGAACTSTSVTVVASIDVYGLSAQATVPLVVLERLELDFVGYPNSGESITQLGQVQCTTTYHHATARARVFLSSTPTLPIDVSALTSFSSTSEAVVLPSGSRMQALAAGDVNISASFGSSMVDSAPLSVVDDVLTVVQSVEWSISLVDGDTLSKEVGVSQASTASLHFDNGVVFSDIGGATFSGWLEPMELVSYESSRPDVINVSSIGALTLQDNWYAPVQLQAQVACDAATNTTKDVYANLLPSEGDVDLGNEVQQQFLQQVGSTLPVAVRIRTPAGYFLKAFQLELRFPTAASGVPSFLSSGSGATYEDTNNFPGVAERLNAPPHIAELVWSDAASMLDGTLRIGMLRLKVVGSGVMLVTGTIVDMIFESGTITQQRVDQPIVAGTGFASLSIGLRRRGLGAVPLESPQLAAAARRGPSRRAQDACTDPCTVAGGGGIWGDFSGDCKFTVDDVLQLQLYRSYL